jgi:hypothetical protein
VVNFIQDLTTGFYRRMEWNIVGQQEDASLPTARAEVAAAGLTNSSISLVEKDQPTQVLPTNTLEYVGTSQL